MTGKVLLLGCCLAMAFVAGLQQPGQCGGGNRLRLEARLSGEGTPASGKAKFEARGTRLRLSVEVEDFITAPGVAVIDVAGHTYTVNLSAAAGFGDLNLDTENGQAVPDLSGGGTVVVTSGDEQISGRF